MSAFAFLCPCLFCAALYHSTNHPFEGVIVQLFFISHPHLMAFDILELMGWSSLWQGTAVGSVLHSKPVGYVCH